MALDPENLYEVDSDVPDLTGAVLLHYFDGFMDAGSAGQVLAEHLLKSHEHRVIARFDVDDLIDYRSRRPVMTFATDHWEDYQAPELVVHLLHDSSGTPFLLLTGPEPDRRWEAFAAAVRSLVERWGVRLSVGMHGIPMGVPHTRPLGLVAHASREELVADHPKFFNRVQVPGNIAGLLELRLAEAGHDAMGFAVHVPHYLAQSTYPAAALTLLKAITDATGLVLPTDALRESARRADAEIERQVVESDEVAQVVRALERQYDMFTEASGKESLLLDPNEPLPSADELGAEFERFLAEQQERPGPGPQEH
ncbi:proteasome assembly chaperone family protein [Goodfellowiella coeruleoviolacea]|uniref:ATP-dependent carboligase, ATP-grasp superfamily n=1 Tax=Goodfellowiella coeruleoviolacea TaxID=334858 RepID=A0AAE3G9Z9_9PSEU|nr:PAC2 family protein [Goodfellowiella coeruleoviolacea]MCP2163983.1 putative ATP-dependent carboligase, ATP-grasp superfamily [Goodfellowiella coeruleoviolacea]